MDGWLQIKADEKLWKNKRKMYFLINTGNIVEQRNETVRKSSLEESTK